MGNERPARILLDRDGVLNVEAPGLRVISPETFQWQAGSKGALRRLCALGWRPGLASNQSVIGRGLVAEDAVSALHDAVFNELIAPADRFVCPHAPDAGCPCRKPEPGLLLRAAAAWDVAPSSVLFVGDALSDWKASQAAGTMFALVATGKGRATAATLTERTEIDNLWGSQVFPDLDAFVTHLSRATDAGES